MATLIEMLAKLNPESSKNTLRSWVEKGRVSVDGRLVTKPNTPVSSEGQISVGKRTHFLDQGIQILFEDRDCIVIYKPEGLLSVATDFQTEFTAHTFLKRRFHSQRVYPVHRLDRETSGVMVFAYTDLARDELQNQFAEHSIEREYTAIVEGALEPASGTWKSHLREDQNYNVISGEEGKLAITHYETLSRNKRFSLLRVTLETGRKNQIRVHCKAAGHPIAGDIKYCSTLNPLGRLCLHATKLGFVHPRTKKMLRFDSPIPAAFSSFFKHSG